MGAFVVGLALVSGFFYILALPSNQLQVLVSDLPYWVSGQSGSINLTPAGGIPPYHCYVKEGSALPTGFSLSDDCVFSGTAPALAGGSTKRISPPFTVVVNDSAMPPASIEVVYQFTTVSELPTLIPVSSNSCTVGKYCSVQVAKASGGVPPYTFMSDSFSTGAPPAGMIVDVNGYLVGTPKTTGAGSSKSGRYSFGVCVKDSIGSSSCEETSVVIYPGSTTSSTSPSGGGYCSSNSDCKSFALKYCGGSSNVRCGSDRLCHCCLTLRGETCISCPASGCTGGTYCDKGVCVFQKGGKTTD